MTAKKRFMMLACMNIEDEIASAMQECGADFPVLYMPSDNHNFPQQMNTHLQQIIDTLTDIDYLLLPMGRCGNATVGLHSSRFSLVLPRCEDCVNLLLSEDSLKVNRPNYTMFFTAGWLRGKQAPDISHARTVKKYGEDKAKMLEQMIYGQYRDFALLETGLYDTNIVKQRLTPLAECVAVNFKELAAPFGVLKKMVRLELEDDNFVIVPPGTVVTEEMLEPNCV